MVDERARCRDWFHEALGDRPLWTVDDLFAMIDRGEARIWNNPNSALFLRIDTYPTTGERVLEVGPAGGDLEEIVASVPRIEAWARAQGITQSHVQSGREGWARVLAPLGYETTTTTIRKVFA